MREPSTIVASETWISSLARGWWQQVAAHRAAHAHGQHEVQPAPALLGDVRARAGPDATPCAEPGSLIQPLACAVQATPHSHRQREGVGVDRPAGAPS